MKKKVNSSNSEDEMTYSFFTCQITADFKAIGSLFMRDWCSIWVTVLSAGGNVCWHSLIWEAFGQDLSSFWQFFLMKESMRWNKGNVQGCLLQSSWNKEQKPSNLFPFIVKNTLNKAMWLYAKLISDHNWFLLENMR